MGCGVPWGHIWSGQKYLDPAALREQVEAIDTTGANVVRMLIEFMDAPAGWPNSAGDHFDGNVDSVIAHSIQPLVDLLKEKQIYTVLDHHGHVLVGPELVMQQTNVLLAFGEVPSNKGFGFGIDGQTDPADAGTVSIPLDHQRMVHGTHPGFGKAQVCMTGNDEIDT